MNREQSTVLETTSFSILANFWENSNVKRMNGTTSLFPSPFDSSVNLPFGSQDVERHKINATIEGVGAIVGARPKKPIATLYAISRYSLGVIETPVHRTPQFRGSFIFDRVRGRLSHPAVSPHIRVSSIPPLPLLFLYFLLILYPSILFPSTPFILHCSFFRGFHAMQASWRRRRINQLSNERPLIAPAIISWSIECGALELIRTMTCSMERCSPGGGRSSNVAGQIAYLKWAVSTLARLGRHQKQETLPPDKRNKLRRPWWVWRLPLPAPNLCLFLSRSLFLFVLVSPTGLNMIPR